MAELLSPGVFIEEVPSPTLTIAGVSTSNMGTVGFTPKGPVDEATLVTSFIQFEKIFGGLTRNSFMPHSVAAFYANGGQRAFIVRVVPADATESDCRIQNDNVDDQIEEGDGATLAFSALAATTLFKVADGDAPIRPSTVSILTRAADTPVVAEATMERDGVTPLVTVGAVANYEGRIDPATSVQAYDPDFDMIVRGTVTITDVAATFSFTIPVGTGSIVTATAGAAPNNGTCVFDHKTGRFSINLNGTLIPVGATAIQADFTPTTANLEVTDDGSGNLSDTGATATGTIDYDTGAWDITFTTAPANLTPFLASYTTEAWDLKPISMGVWADGLRVSVSGDLDYYNIYTGQYTRWNFTVSELDAASGDYVVQETFEETSFTDSTSAQYMPDVINELSDLMNVETPGSDYAPPQLLAVQRQNVVLAGGDESAGGQTITGTLPGYPVLQRSVTISWTDNAGVAKSITDDGRGNLTGDVDATGNNTINYTTGAVDFMTSATIDGASLVVATYYSQPVSTSLSEDFGDTTKQYTRGSVTYYASGSDGTFDATNYSRNEFTAPTLQASYRGLYALDRVEELMQVQIPDFAGDVTVTGDLLDYAATHAAQPRGGDRFIILTVPIGSDPQEAVDWFRYDLGRYSDYAAIYWPWIKIADPLANNRPLTMPPMGHVAGVYARTDSTRTVAKAPAGTVDGALNYLIGLEYIATQGERDFVYPNKINPLISGTSTGLAVWGCRTISNRSEWRYVNVRRLFMFLESSVFNSTFWIVFENNGPALWARITLQLNSFLLNLYNNGYFAGTSPSQAYFVICDNTNNDEASINNGEVICDVGVAPQKPAEFVRFRFAQKSLSA